MCDALVSAEEPMPERQPSYPRPQQSPERVRRLARAVLDAHAVVDLHELGVDVAKSTDGAAIRRTLQDRVDALATAARALARPDSLRDASEAVQEAHTRWQATPEHSDERRRAALELVFALLWLHDEIRVYELAS